MHTPPKRLRIVIAAVLATTLTGSLNLLGDSSQTNECTTILNLLRLIFEPCLTLL
jgi:hypothetical protein